MVSDVEILEWMKENYPDYATNIELARKLYNRLVLGKKKADIVTISELELEEWATIKGVVVDVYEPATYEGCPVCKRGVKRGCEHLDSGQEQPVMLKIHKFIVNDGTGEVFVVGSPTEQDELVHIGDEVKIRGRLKKGYKDRVEFSVYEMEIIKEAPRIVRINPDVYRLLTDLKSMGKLRKTLFETMLSNLGVTIDAVDKYIKVEGEYVYPVVEEIDKITQ